VDERPAFLGEEHAKAFDDPAVARAYRLRQPYPPRVFEELLKLLGTRPGWILDLGCGTGLLARTLIRHVGRVDAIDPAAAMIEEARVQPGGRDRGIRWIVGRAEDARLAGPYGLAVAGESIQWMDWNVVLPRVARALAPGAFLALLKLTVVSPWEDEVGEIVRRFSRNPTWDPSFDVIAELQRRGLWTKAGDIELEPIARRQSVVDYIESFHAQSSLTKRRLGKDAFAFDDAMRGLARRHGATDVELKVTAGIAWGTPIASGEAEVTPPAPPAAPADRRRRGWRSRRRMP
jgi:SAM-dependent methyltransferase